MRIRSRKSWFGMSLLAGALAAGHASAEPILQLYIEGATYDAANESWYIGSHDFRLWAIGNVSGPGGAKGLPITNVRLAVSYDDPGTPVTITLTPTRIGGSGSYLGFTDPSTAPGAALLGGPHTDGSTPLIGGTHHLPGHGEFGTGRAWQEFLLGDFTTSDSQLGNFVNTFPTPGGFTAQIHAYDVHVEGADAHFDLYAQIQDSRGRTYVFAPPSHDATDGPESVPLPGTLALLGIGALGLGALRRKPR